MSSDSRGYSSDYAEESLSFEQLAALPGDVLIEFGTPWCGHCSAAQAAIQEVLAESGMRHIKVFDGKGKRLGRGFRVKLWPTLILLRDGKELARLVRPLHASEVRQLVNNTC